MGVAKDDETTAGTEDAFAIRALLAAKSAEGVLTGVAVELEVEVGL